MADDGSWRQRSVVRRRRGLANRSECASELSHQRSVGGWAEAGARRPSRDVVDRVDRMLSAMAAGRNRLCGCGPALRAVCFSMLGSQSAAGKLWHQGAAPRILGGGRLQESGWTRRVVRIRAACRPLLSVGPSRTNGGMTSFPPGGLARLGSAASAAGGLRAGGHIRALPQLADCHAKPADVGAAVPYDDPGVVASATASLETE